MTSNSSIIYAVLGGGRWSYVIQKMLNQMERKVVVVRNVRKFAFESDQSYMFRMADLLASSGATAVWICIPPGRCSIMLAEAALRSELHVVMEKPWFESEAEVMRLVSLAKSSRRIVGVNYQYCYLEGLKDWNILYGEASYINFCGCFDVSVNSRHGVPALCNLGSHLLAIRNLMVPESKIGSVICNYESRPLRSVSLLADTGDELSKIDFTANNEPLLQRYVADYERAMVYGGEFKLGIMFAWGVQVELDVLGGGGRQ